MNKKLLSLVAISAITLGVASSCSGNRVQFSVPEVEFVGKEEFDAVYTKEKPLTIRFAHSFGKDATKALEPQLVKFEQTYPNIKLKIETKSHYDKLNEYITMSLPGGNAPDVALGYPDHFASYLKGGALFPLDKFINSKDPEIGIGEGANNASNDFYEYYLPENKQFIDDQTFGLPFNKSTELMFYNKTMLDAINETNPEIKLTVPSRWEDVAEFSEKFLGEIKKNNWFDKDVELPSGKKLYLKGIKEDGVKVNRVRPVTNDSGANLFITLTRDSGATYTEVPEDFTKGYIKFNDPKTVEALDLIEDLGAKGYFGQPENYNEKFASNILTQWKTFFNIGSSAGSIHYAPSASKYFEVGVAPVPTYKGQKNVIQQGTNICMLKNKDTNKYTQTASWLLIRFLTAYHTAEYDPNADFARKASYLPVRKSGTNSESYQKFLDQDLTKIAQDKAICVLSSKQATEYAKDNWNAFVDPAFIGSSKVRNEVDSIIPAICKEGAHKSPQEAIDSAYKQLKAFQPEK